MLIFLPCNPVKAIAASSAVIASGARQSFIDRRVAEGRLPRSAHNDFLSTIIPLRFKLFPSIIAVRQTSLCFFQLFLHFYDFFFFLLIKLITRHHGLQVLYFFFV